MSTLSADLSSFTSYYDSFESTDEYKRAYKDFSDSLDSDNWDNTVILLVLLIGIIASNLSEASKAAVQSEEFNTLTNKEKADIIRNTIAPVIDRGYALIEKLTRKAYYVYLSRTGKPFIIPNTYIDSDRVKSVIAKSITVALNGDNPGSFMSKSFDTVMRTAHGDVLSAVARTIKSEDAGRILARRVLHSTNPCDYCKAHAGIWFEASSENTPLYFFHDKCRCSIEFASVV